jgi:hypothetical protein
MFYTLLAFKQVPQPAHVISLSLSSAFPAYSTPRFDLFFSHETAFAWRAEEERSGGKRNLLNVDGKRNYEEPEKVKDERKSVPVSVKEERKSVPVSREERKPEREEEEKYGECFRLSRFRLRGGIVDFVCNEVLRLLSCYKTGFWKYYRNRLGGFPTSMIFQVSIEQLDTVLPPIPVHLQSPSFQTPARYKFGGL